LAGIFRWTDPFRRGFCRIRCHAPVWQGNRILT